jgi:formylglycine-generating enzyme required for sulfatase activity
VFCIDATEVTSAQYAQWLATNPVPNDDPRACSWKTNHEPTVGLTGDAMPVVGVDWCDAYAFCAAAGKRLCGRIGGGATGYLNEWEQPSSSQWTFACMGGGGNVYPYGDTYVPGRCNGDAPVGALSLVKDGYPDCRGEVKPFDGIWDMSGNAFEWEDSCNAGSGTGDYCRRRGGWSGSDGTHLQCVGTADAAFRQSSDGMTSFRCCADLP